MNILNIPVTPIIYLQEGRNAVPNEYFTSLIRSMETRASMVKPNKDGSTKYKCTH